MSTHTPGPWTACREGECQCGFIWGADGDTHVASVHGPNVLGADYYGSDVACDAETQKSNIRLIRAAPELLKQAKEFDRLSLVIESEIRNALGADSPAREGILLAIKANRAAIAKAEGRE